MKKLNEKGFTIVELLIVIVVIAILAAIVIVAYNGVTNRSKSSSAQGAASSIMKKVEAYNAEEGRYPFNFSELTGAASSKSYAVPTGTVTLVSSISNNSLDPNNIIFRTCGTGSPANAAAITATNVVGAQAVWRDYANNANSSAINAGTTTGTGVLCRENS